VRLCEGNTFLGSPASRLLSGLVRPAERNAGEREPLKDHNGRREVLWEHRVSFQGGTNPGILRARISCFFPQTGIVFLKTGMVSRKSGIFHA